MLTIEHGVTLLSMISKLDIKLDVNALSQENASQIGMEVLGAALKNLPKIKNELYELIASFKEIPVDEVKKLPLKETITELVAELKDFFQGALQ